MSLWTKHCGVINQINLFGSTITQYFFFLNILSNEISSFVYFLLCFLLRVKGVRKQQASKHVRLLYPCKLTVKQKTHFNKHFSAYSIPRHQMPSKLITKSIFRTLKGLQPQAGQVCFVVVLKIYVLSYGLTYNTKYCPEGNS